MDGLFGKQRGYLDRIRKEDVAVESIGSILRSLSALPQEAWMKYAFSREPLNGRFTDAERIALGEKADACGRFYASELTRAFASEDIDTIVSCLHLQVECPEIPQHADRVLFAEFREPDRINIFMDGIRKCSPFLEDPAVRDALGDTDIRKLLLGHEIFHFVEEKHKAEIFTHTYRHTLWTLGPLKNRSEIAVLSEIAAMGFTRELNHLSFSPYLMDAFLIYGYSPEAASQLCREMLQFSK